MKKHIPLEKLQEGMSNLHYQISTEGSSKIPRHDHSHHHIHKHDESAEDGALYYCPMLCEGDKKYPKPGDCPVCGMHLVKERKLTQGKKEYTCPMHPEIIRYEPGSCPI